MRKCFLKKALASILSSAMIVSAVPQADLATISAAKKNVGLNTTFKTLKVGKSYKLKLKNNSINWKIQKISTTNKKICTVYKKKSTSVLLKGKNVGRATIKVKIKTSKRRKYNKKILKCRVKVVPKKYATIPEPQPDQVPEQITTYNVIFNTNGGSLISGQTVESGKTIVKPNDPTKQGYVFKGWYSDLNLEKAYDFSSTVSDNITLYAKWNNAYIVKFQTNGGNRIENQVIENGDKVARPINPTRPRSTFVDWFSDSQLKEKYDFSNPVTKDITIYAKWQVENNYQPNWDYTGGNGTGNNTGNNHVTQVKYTIKFDSNGGSEIEDQIVEGGNNTIKPNDPIKEGYVFDGWYIDKDLEIVYDFKTAVKENITLYAKWNAISPKKYTIKFNTNGGSIIEDQIIENANTAIKPDDPTKEGCVFSGWYIDEEFSIKFDFSEIISNNITLYAKWDENNDNLNDNRIDLGDIEHLNDRGIIDVMYDETGNISMIDGKFTNEKVNSTSDAAKIFNLASDIFNPKNDNYQHDFYVEESEITSQEINDSNMLDHSKETFYRYSPKIENIPVLGSQIILTTKDNGEASGIFSTYDDRIQNVNIYPSINSGIAKENVFNLLIDDEIKDSINNGNINKDDLYNLFDITSELIIYANDKRESPILAYEVRINGIDDINNIYYIHANGSNAGQVIDVISENQDIQMDISSEDMLDQQRTFKAEFNNNKYFLMDSGRNIHTYKSDRTTRKKYWLFGDDIVEYKIPGTIFTADNQENIEKAAVSAHANMSVVYDYYKNVLNRNSFDNNNKKIIITYNYYTDKENERGENAFWSNSKKQFIFQSATDGNESIYQKAIDAMGHEYTHAVINSVVGGWLDKGLHYKGETGALNESYADIMGSLIENKEGNDRWLIGEDARALRNMSDPSQFRQPEHYDNFDKNYKDDNGGVHRYSGIFNFAAYKMMSDRRNSNVSKETWAKIYYNSLHRLSTDAKFLDARAAILATAKSYGFTNEQQEAIKKAFDDVGITEPESIRIVLTWGAEPRDLDSHLVGPGIGLFSQRFHIYFGEKNYYKNGSYSADSKDYAADLDYDDTTSFGPEITTIHSLTPGDYYFYVHDYTNGSSTDSKEMANSNAQVKIYYNDSHNLQQTFNVDKNSSGTYWNVFKLTIDNDKNISVSEINTYSSNASYD